MYIRVGFGTDFHKITPGDGLTLGGVFIPCGMASEAASDGDVLLHALVDALLGAAGMGDIGERYPEKDVEPGQASSRFVQEVVADLHAMNATLINVDCVIDLEKPKLENWKPEIKNRLADLLNVDAGKINVKAKTCEGLGPIGTGQALAAQVAVLLEMHD